MTSWILYWRAKARRAIRALLPSHRRRRRIRRPLRPPLLPRCHCRPAGAVLGRTTSASSFSLGWRGCGGLAPLRIAARSSRVVAAGLVRLNAGLDLVGRGARARVALRSLGAVVSSADAPVRDVGAQGFARCRLRLDAPRSSAESVTAAWSGSSDIAGQRFASVAPRSLHRVAARAGGSPDRAAARASTSSSAARCARSSSAIRACRSATGIW